MLVTSNNNSTGNQFGIPANNNNNQIPIMNQQHTIYQNPATNNGQQQAQQQQQEKAAPLHITTEKLDFPDLIATMYSDTEKLCYLINSLFRPVFSDYYGSKVEIVQNRQLYTTIYFHDNGLNNTTSGQYRGIERIIDKNNLNNAEDRINAINKFMTTTVNNRKFYKLTNEAKQLLKDVIPSQFINKANGHVNWDNLMRECTSQNQFGQSQICIQIVVDLVRIIKLLYGARSDNGGVWNYMINVGSPINPINTPNGGILSNKWQIFIMRTNSKDVTEVAAQYGFTYGGNDMGIITR